jgi:hypothetical protein
VLGRFAKLGYLFDFMRIQQWYKVKPTIVRGCLFLQINQ